MKKDPKIHCLALKLYTGPPNCITGASKSGGLGARAPLDPLVNSLGPWNSGLYPGVLVGGTQTPTAAVINESSAKHTSEKSYSQITHEEKQQ